MWCVNVHYDEMWETHARSLRNVLFISKIYNTHQVIIQNAYNNVPKWCTNDTRHGLLVHYIAPRDVTMIYSGQASYRLHTPGINGNRPFTTLIDTIMYNLSLHTQHINLSLCTVYNIYVGLTSGVLRKQLATNVSGTLLHSVIFGGTFDTTRKANISKTWNALLQREGKMGPVSRPSYLYHGDP